MNRDFVETLDMAPSRIDLLTGVSGLSFSDAWPDHVTVRVENMDVPVIGRDALLRNKRAAGRPRDLADIAELEEKG